eukprot:Tbor_TRINITY_DN5823_c0_g1::TRINITY_DN5823_c0_g1_i2::g.6136::m.6136
MGLIRSALVLVLLLHVSSLGVQAKGEKGAKENDSANTKTAKDKVDEANTELARATAKAQEAVKQEETANAIANEASVKAVGQAEGAKTKADAAVSKANDEEAKTNAAKGVAKDVAEAAEDVVK